MKPTWYRLCHYSRICLFAILLLLLVGCGEFNVSVGVLPSPEVTQVTAVKATRTPTQQPSASATPSPTSTLPPTFTTRPRLPIPPNAGLITDNNGKLRITELGGKVSTLMTLPTGSQVAISPFGTRVLYVEDQDIWLYNVLTGKHQNLTHTTERSEDRPTFWPSRPDVILFSSSLKSDHVEEIVASPGYLSMVRSDGSDYRILDAEHRICGAPSPSPDGATIAYGCGETARLYRWELGPEPFDPKEFGMQEDEYAVIHTPAWSPDGIHIAWVVTEKPNNGKVRIAIFNIENHSVTFLEPAGEPTLLGYQPTMVWSPNGRWLTYNPVTGIAEEPEDRGYWVVRVGEDPLRPQYLGFLDEPVWSPDGYWLAFPNYNAEVDTVPLRILAVGTWHEEAVTNLFMGSKVVAWAPVREEA
ncbi:MAG: hypothetical protein GTO14_07960, partial [Anaerolineales bacterium]|nr:hypothetical protein [Anaerolineales bacterium]